MSAQDDYPHLAAASAPRWVECDLCEGVDALVDENGNWHDCWMCNGAGGSWVTEDDPDSAG